MKHALRDNKMSCLRRASVTCFLLATSIGTTLILYYVFDNTQTFTPPVLRKPAPRIHYGLYPANTNLLNLKNFSYLINTDACSGDASITAVIIVTSHAGDIQARSAQRRAYPSDELQKLKLRRVFLLAVPQENDSKYSYITQNELLDENRRYSDLIQGDFLEAYKNLTYKHVMGLQWAVMYCPQAKYIIKMDDDIVVDFYQLINLIVEEENIQPITLFGYFLVGTIPVREKASKWYVTKEEYPHSIYPPFLSGWLYVTKPEIAKKLISASNNVPYFWIDDTFVTGILAKKLGIQHQDMKDKFTLHVEYLKCCLENIKYSCDFIVGPNGGDGKLILKFQELAKRCHELHCPKRPDEIALNKKCVVELKSVLPERGLGEIQQIQLF